MVIGIVLCGLILFGVCYIIAALIKGKQKDDEYIEPNKYITLQDCLDLYYYDDKKIVINNGEVTDIAKRQHTKL